MIGAPYLQQMHRHEYGSKPNHATMLCPREDTLFS